MSWNAELLGPVVEDVTKMWKSFDEKLEELKEKCFSALAGLIDGIRDELKGK